MNLKYIAALLIVATSAQAADHPEFREGFVGTLDMRLTQAEIGHLQPSTDLRISRAVDRSGKRFGGTVGIAVLPHSIPLSDLDFPLFYRPSVSFIYPAVQRGRKMTAKVRGAISITETGRIQRVSVTSGSDDRFKEAAECFVYGWSLSTPMKDGQPCRAHGSFEVEIDEVGVRSTLK